MTKEENLKFREDKIKAEYKHHFHKEPDLENPKTFNEKIQWMKLYYNDPLMTKCADKYLVEEYVKEKITDKYSIPVFGVWDDPEDIDFNSLPNQFVLKVNWGTGQNIVVKDKSKLNIQETKATLKSWMQPFANNYYFDYEWQYKNMQPKIVCQKYLKDDKTDNLIVYGVYCFNGKPHYIHTITDAHSGNDKLNMYDTKWNKLDMVYIFKNVDYDIPKPLHLETMLELSEKLSADFKHVRVDFFVVNEQLYFSELTFTTSDGSSKFEPEEWDYKFGELFELPKEKKLEYDNIDKNTLLEQIFRFEKSSVYYKNLEGKYNRLETERIRKSFILFGFTVTKHYINIYFFGIKGVIKRKNKF